MLGERGGECELGRERMSEWDKDNLWLREWA